MAAFRALNSPFRDQISSIFERKYQVIRSSANDLFSHPETHRPHAQSGPADSGKPSWTDLFLEPVPAPRAPSEH